MKKAVEIQLRCMPVAVINAVRQMHLYPVKSQVKRVPEVAPANPEILHSIASNPDKSENCTIDPLKVCGICKVSKPFFDFSRNRHAGDGRHYYCKTCVRSKNNKTYVPQMSDFEVREGAILGANARMQSAATSTLTTYTRAQISEALGIPVTTFDKGLVDGIYPDFDYWEGSRRVWFKETLLEILKQRASGVKPCSVCKVVKPLFEFKRQQQCHDGYQGVCSACATASRLDRGTSVLSPFEMPEPTPYDPSRVGHDRLETHAFLNDLRAKFGGVPTDAIRSGIVRRDEMTV